MNHKHKIQALINQKKEELERTESLLELEQLDHCPTIVARTRKKILLGFITELEEVLKE